MSTSYVCEHPDCQAEGTEAMPGGERYCAKHAPEPLADCVARPIASVPGEARPAVHSHAPNGVTVRPVSQVKS